MSAYTETELDELITAHKAAILVVVRGGRSYNLNTGQGQQAVTRESLKELQASLEYLQNEKEELNGRSDFTSWEV
jgi:hypothetical protein